MVGGIVFYEHNFPNLESFFVFQQSSAVQTKIVSHDCIGADLHILFYQSCHQYFVFRLFQSTLQMSFFSFVCLVTNKALTLKVPITTVAENNFTFIFFQRTVLTFHVNHLPISVQYPGQLMPWPVVCCLSVCHPSVCH